MLLLAYQRWNKRDHAPKEIQSEAAVKDQINNAEVINLHIYFLIIWCLFVGLLVPKMWAFHSFIHFNRQSEELLLNYSIFISVCCQMYLLGFLL